MQPNMITSIYGIKIINAIMYYSEDFYELFITDEIFEHIIEQTNLYALQLRMIPKCL